MKDIGVGKHIVDAASIGIATATVIKLLPAIAAALSIIWFLIRIWETKTVRWWLRRWRK